MTVRVLEMDAVHQTTTLTYMGMKELCSKVMW